MATVGNKLNNTVKVWVCNNKHPHYKFANQAYLLSGRTAGRDGGRPLPRGSDFLLITNDLFKRTLSIKQEAELKSLFWV